MFSSVFTGFNFFIFLLCWLMAGIVLKVLFVQALHIQHSRNGNLLWHRRLGSYAMKIATMPLSLLVLLLIFITGPRSAIEQFRELRALNLTENEPVSQKSKLMY